MLPCRATRIATCRPPRPLDPDTLSLTRAAESGKSDAAQAPAAGAELVPPRAGLLLGRGGGHEQQSQDRPQESVRIPVLQVLRTRAISYTCGLAATQPRPQVLLKNHREKCVQSDYSAIDLYDVSYQIQWPTCSSGSGILLCPG